MDQTENVRPATAADRGALITMDGAMAELKIGKNTLYKHVKDGSLRTVRLGRRRYTTARFIDEFVAALEAGAA